MGLFAFLGVLTACTGGRTQEEEEALDFLYAGMPLPDSVDYSRDFWEANVKVAVKARHEMPWGEKVPGREWRHFVLPLRVNNEDLDSFRIVYYDELKERVKGMMTLIYIDMVREITCKCLHVIIFSEKIAVGSAMSECIQSPVFRTSYPH